MSIKTTEEPPDQDIPEAREAAKQIWIKFGTNMGEYLTPSATLGLISTACREYAKRENAELLKEKELGYFGMADAKSYDLLKQQLSSLRKENELLREQIRVADVAFQGLHERHQKLEKSICHSAEANRAWLAEFDALTARAEKAEKERDELRQRIATAVRPLLNYLWRNGWGVDAEVYHDFLSKYPDLQ